MVQRRMVYADLWQDEDFAKLSDKGKILYIGLIILADDYGRLKNNAHFLKSQIFLYDEEIKTSEIVDIIKQIDELGLAKLYHNEQYIYHPNWFKYQILRKDRLGRCLCPDPDNQMTTKWQPTDGQVGAEVSKEVSNKESNSSSLRDFRPDFIKRKNI